MIPNFIWEGEEQKLVTRARGLTLPDIKTYKKTWPLWGCGVRARELTGASRSRPVTTRALDLGKRGLSAVGKDSHFNNRSGAGAYPYGKKVSLFGGTLIPPIHIKIDSRHLDMGLYVKRTK